MSTSLALGVVGAAIGSLFGMPMLGFAIGSTIGAVISQEDIEGPRLEERNVQVSSLGAPIQISFGTWRHTGNVIWPKDFQMDEHSHTESAKGGPEQTTYTYTATFAVLMCKGPKAGIGRIWANKKLIYDPTQPLGDVGIWGFHFNRQRDPCISGLRFMLGGEDQEPDPLMVARDGSAPAYRDSVLIIFEDLDCTDFGNRPPVIEAEVFGEATSSGPPDPRFESDGDAAPADNIVTTYGLVDPVTGYIWSTSRTSLASSVETRVTDDEAQAQLTSISTPCLSMTINTIIYVPSGASGREIWVMGWQFGQHNFAFIYNADSITLEDTVDLGNYEFLSTAAYDPVTQKVITFDQDNECLVINPLLRAVESSFSLPGTTGTATGAIVTIDYIAAFVDDGLGKLYLLNLADYSVAQVIDEPFYGLHFTGFAYDPTRERLLHNGGSGTGYSVIDIASGVVTLHTLTAADDADPDYSDDVRTIVYSPSNDRYMLVANANPAGVGPATKTTLYTVNPDSYVTESTHTYEDYDAAYDPMTLPPMLIPKGEPNYLFVFDQVRIKRYYMGGTIVGGPVTLASIVTAISTGEPGGLEDADIDVTELDDLVAGYCITQQTTRVSALTPLALAYYFDGVGSDHILKFPKRGRSPSVTIAKADRAAHEAGSDTPPDLKIARGAELERPYRVDVNYLTAARDYQVANQYHNRTTRDANQQVTLDLPLVLADSKAKSVAMVNLYAAWLRTVFTFSTDNSYAKYEPTDVFTVETDDATYIVRAMKRSDDGAGVISWEGQIEDAAVYDQEGIVPADDFPPQTIRDPGDTVLYLLDMPILRDADNDAGFYVAMGGTEGWRGAQLFKSVDSGSTYDPVLSITNAAAIGTAQSVLGDFTVGNIFDEGNSVTVRLESGGPLISATTDQVLSGANTAVIGAPGRWEVINYREASLLAPNTYQLSGLLRGRRGTEWATGLHAAGDAFVLARLQTWQRTGANAAEIGVARLYKAPPFRTRLSEADEQAFTNAAVGLKPYSPVELRAHRSGADLVIEWDRRSRIGYGTLHAIVPVGEASESYRIQVMDGSSVKRTLTSSTETVTYTAADQTTDWGSTTGPYVVRVAQVSATVGAGYINEESLA